MCGYSSSILHLSKTFLLCSFSSTHIQLRLSSLVCRIIVLQKYTVCFREEARLVSALMNESNLFLDLALVPACFELLPGVQRRAGGGRWMAFLLSSSPAAPGGVCGSDAGLAWALEVA